MSPPMPSGCRWLTNFRGSAGVAIVTLKKAAIFVDGRYVIQVRQQVDEKIFPPFHLIEEPPTAWIAKNLKKGDRLGFDPWLVTADQAKRFREACEGVGAGFVAVDTNPIDAVWKDQPRAAHGGACHAAHAIRGRTAAEKIKDIRRRSARRDAVVLTQPDSVAWLFNLRGFDVPLHAGRRRLCDPARQGQGRALHRSGEAHRGCEGASEERSPSRARPMRSTRR